MNKNILIASAITAGTVALLYILKKRMGGVSQPETHMPAEHSRHLTNVFSKAKHN